MNDASSPAPIADGSRAAEPAGACAAPRRLPMAARRAPRRAPVECGDLPFLIRRDGTWLYRGSPISRKELVCLFASVLQREADGQFWLETPAERGRIEVEDAPFVAVELDWTGDGRQQVLSFRTNVDQVVTAGPEHPIRVAHDLLTCEPTPYILVRAGAGRRWRSRRASTARCITSWSPWRCRNGSAAGACSASGAAASSSRWANCRPAKSDPRRAMTLRGEPSS